MAMPKSLTTVTPLSKILAIILFIITLILAFYLGTQHKEFIKFVQTANWKTYTNDELKFSVNYPPSLKITQNEWCCKTSPSDKITKTVFDLVINDENSDENVIVEIRPNPSNLYGPVNKIEDAFGDGVTNPIYFKIQNYAAAKFEKEIGPTTKSVTIWILKDKPDKTLVTISGTVNNRLEKYNEINQILSTFIFLD